MALKILREVTEWAVEYRQPNHVYLMSGDRVLAYVPWGQGQPVYFQGAQRMDRRRRKFVEERKNPWGFDLSLEVQDEPAESPPQGQTWKVPGSKGNVYTVSLHNGQWACTCPGHGFRRKCRHVDEISAQHQAA